MRAKAFLKAILALAALRAALSAAALPTPSFASDAVVHDPSVVRSGDTFYVFGSHMASASTTDLMNWTQITTGPFYPNSLIRNQNPQTEFATALAWAQTNTFWGPDVIQLGDGKYYFYYCACRGDAPLSALGLAISDAITGPYANVGILLESGMVGLSPAGVNYDVNIHPNVVDPSVFFDHTGKLWMVYGSFSGGIFILALDSTPGSPTIGQPLPDQGGYGRKLIGGNSSRIEGPYIVYSPESGYYYLFMTFGGFDAAGGYNIRVGRSLNPDGPYLDAAGNDLTNVKGNFPFDDATIAPYGVKLMGNYQFVPVAGEPQTTSRGYLSPGGCSIYRDPSTGQYFLVFHTRFVGLGEQHQVRVHQMFLNDQGWFVIAPQRYAHETIHPITARQIPGDYKFINHGKAISAAVNYSSVITLGAGGSVSGAVSGTWALSGDYFATLTLGEVEFHGDFVLQWDEDNQAWVLGFAAVASNGVAVWGSKVAAVGAVDAPAITSEPAAQSAALNGSVTLSATVTGAPVPDLQWSKDGNPIGDATRATHVIASLTANGAGLYTLAASNFAGVAETDPVIVGLSINEKVAGDGVELQPANIVHPNGNVFDQVLLTGTAEAVTADFTLGQITRTSYIDLNDDIVQVEFAGPGTLSLVLDSASATGPAAPVNYNQPDVLYMKGHAGIVITGADERTNLSVFTVGRATAFDPTGTYNFLQPASAANDPADNGSPLFAGHEATNYDGIADLAFIAVASTNGKFGGIRAANAHFFASQGLTGIYAPNVDFQGPVFVGNISGYDTAQAAIILGSATDTRVTGGSLLQANGQPVEVSGITQLRFTDGADSQAHILPAQTNRAVLMQNGHDVTSQIVVNPGS